MEYCDEKPIELKQIVFKDDVIKTVTLSLDRRLNESKVFPNELCNVKSDLLTEIGNMSGFYTTELPFKRGKTGKWLSYTGTHWTGRENEYGDPEYKEHIFYVCSNCRRKTVIKENFCPSCGADMKSNKGEN